jgi:hypothetical protein
MPVCHNTVTIGIGSRGGEYGIISFVSHASVSQHKPF